ncbi:MAG: ABC transporter permease subunit [Chloroflexi bacterium]|nr:ABC transporter permease subunit [Chloroflexota bacterium]
MSFALLRVNVRLSQWAIFGWIVFLVAYALFVVLIYPSIAQSTGLLEYMKSLPESMLGSFGLTPEIIDELFGKEGFSLDGWLVTEFLNYWPIVVGIYAFMFGSGILSREADRGTIELLLSHPVQRYTIVATKFVALLAILALLLVASLAGVLLGTLFVEGGVDLGRMSLVLVQAGMAVAAIAAYSTLVSCLVLDPRRSVAIVGGIMAASFILNMLVPALGAAAWLGKLSLFYYYRPFDVVFRGELAASSTLVYLGVTGVCFLAALVVVQRRRAVI